MEFMNYRSIKNLILPSKENDFKSIFLQSNFLLRLVVVLLIFKIATVFISINIPQNIFFADITKYALENLVNRTRQSLGLNPLMENNKLNEAAKLKAQNMIQYHYFDHTSPTGLSPWHWFTQSGYAYKYAGENLAVGFFDSQEVYQAWLNSPSHKANIINPNYTEVGTAILSGFGDNNTIIVVQEFGKPAPAKATTNNVPTKNAAPAQIADDKTEQRPSETSETKINQEVLSQYAESDSIKPASANALNNLPSKSINYILYNYESLLQYAIYGVSLVVIAILMVLIFFNFHISLKKHLVFRIVLIIVILSSAILIDKQVIISFIPHQVLI